MVAFIDPRHSRVDIAQATGRAMRKPHGTNKTLGYIVVPLFLEREGDETPEQALERSDFSDVADVLNALQEQDEELIEIIRNLMEAKGRGEVFDPRRLADKIEVLGPTIELSRLRSNVFAQVLDRIGVSWHEMFGRLQKYKEREGHCCVPKLYKENGFRLGQWVSNQRRQKQTLSEARRQQLDELGFVWDTFETNWAEGLRYLTIYKEREGHCRVPATYKENGFRLGQWVVVQRGNADTLSEARRQQLDELGFDWDPFATDWADGLRCLRIYKEREGHCRVPRLHKENGFRLGRWVDNLRQKTLPEARRQQLDELGFDWDPLETDWADGLRCLTIYKEVPSGTWLELEAT
jgi:hypothetical protein